MEIVFSAHALADLSYWKKAKDEKTLKRIRTLLEAIGQDPFRGIGKPEPLKHDYAGMWSRRINREHRLIYEVGRHSITVHALREHY